MVIENSLLSASQFIKAVEERQGFKIGCIEEISYLNKWINKTKLLELSRRYKKFFLWKILKKT